MASEWAHTKIGQVAHRVTKGTTPTTIGGQFTEGGIAFVKAESITDDGRIDETKVAHIDGVTNELLSRSVLNEEDILFTIAGTIGRVAMVRRAILPANTNQAVAIIRPNLSVIEPRYLYYALRDRQGVRRALTRVVQSVQANLSLTELSETRIPLPSKQEQRAIAHILGTLDDKIELNRRMNQTLEAMAHAVFKSWFVDFEPFRDQGMQDSPLGEIPVGWRAAILGDIADNPRRGVQPSQIEDNTPYIGLEHMPRHCIALAEWGEGRGIQCSKFEFRSGDILFGKLRPYFHKVGIAPVDGVCSTDILVITPRKHEWFGLVLGCVSSDEFINYTDAASTGTKMPRTNWDDMARYKVVLPAGDIAETFTGIVGALVDRIVASIAESHTIVEIRDALLPKLLSGEIRVKDAETLLEDSI